MFRAIGITIVAVFIALGVGTTIQFLFNRNKTNPSNKKTRK